MKDCAPEALALVLSALCLDLHLWPHKVCCVLPSGTVNNKHLYFSFSYDLWWNRSSPPGTLDLTHANFTKPQYAM